MPRLYDASGIAGVQESAAEVYQADLSPAGGSYSVVSPAVLSFHSGTFTPRASTAVVDVDVVATKVGLAHNSLVLFVGPTNQTPLAPTTQAQFSAMTEGVADGRGVRFFRVGALSAQVAAKRYPTSANVPSAPMHVHARLVVTGLTPGTAVAWELCQTVVGNAQTAQTSGAGANGVHCSSQIDFDGYYYAAVRNDTAATVSVFRIGTSLQHPADQRLADVSVTGATTGDVAVVPDGTKACIANQSANTVTVINTGAPPPGVPSSGLLQPCATTGDTTNGSANITNVPQSVALLLYAGLAVKGSGIPAGAYVTAVSGTTVTISANATATATGVTLTFQMAPTVRGTYTIPTASSNAFGMAIDPTGTYCWICEFSVDKIVPMTIATGAFGTEVSTGAGTGPYRCAITPDGAKLLVINNTTGTVTAYNISGNTVSSTAWTSAVLGGSSQNLNGIAIDPSGTKAYVTARTNNSTYPVTVSSGAIGTALVGSEAPAGNPAVMPDGLTLFVFSNTTAGGSQYSVRQWTLANSSNYTQWRAGAGGDANGQGCVTPDGAIVHTNKTQGQLNDYFGGLFLIRSGTFHNELARVVAWPAT